MNRRLYRCRHDRRLAGVAAGVAEYFELDPTLVRILWFLSIFVGGLGLLLYIGLAIIVPLEPLETSSDETGSEANASPTHPVVPAGHRHQTRGDGRWTTFLGLALVLFGSLALLDVILPTWVDAGRYLFPTFIIGMGALLLFNAVRREPMES